MMHGTYVVKVQNRELVQNRESPLNVAEKSSAWKQQWKARAYGSLS